MTESPWHEAYAKLKAFIAAGATPAEVLEFAQLVGESLPPPSSPEEHQLFAQVQAEVIADENIPQQ